MIHLIKALSSSPNSPHAAFIHVLGSLGCRLLDWLLTASCHTNQFACKVFGYDGAIEAQFLILVTGSFPDSIICTTTFAPLMDMWCPHAWCLLIDRIRSGLLLKTQFSSPSSSLALALASIRRPVLELNCFRTSLPTWGYISRFVVAGPLLPTLMQISSHLAQRYNSISVEVQLHHPAPASDVKLIAASEASAKRHQSLTPKTSLVPVESFADKLLNPQQPLSSQSHLNLASISLPSRKQNL